MCKVFIPKPLIRKTLSRLELQGHFQRSYATSWLTASCPVGLEALAGGGRSDDGKLDAASLAARQGAGHFQAASADVEVEVTEVLAGQGSRIAVNAIFLEMVAGTERHRRSSSATGGPRSVGSESHQYAGGEIGVTPREYRFIEEEDERKLRR